MKPETTNQAGKVEGVCSILSSISQTHKNSSQSPLNTSGTCLFCQKHLAGHWIKVYPDGKKEDYPYGYCRDPKGEIGTCTVFRPKNPLSLGACTA
ncbi:hypothetical protein [Methanospirillum sp.]